MNSPDKRWLEQQKQQKPTTQLDEQRNQFAPDKRCCVHDEDQLKCACKCHQPPVASAYERLTKVIKEMGDGFREMADISAGHQPLVASDGEEVSYEEFVELTKPAQPSPSWEGTINDAPFTAPDCWSKFDKDLRHTLDAFFNDMSEGAVATIKQHVRQLLLSEKERIIGEHNARILNEFQLQMKPDVPMIVYDERIALIPAIEIATKETLSRLS